MIHYSVQPRDRIFVKVYEFLSFAKVMGKYIDKNISKNLRGKYSQIFLDHDKKSATDALNTSSGKSVPKTAEVTGDLIGNKTANKITGYPKSNSERVSNENDKKYPKEIPKGRHRSPEERHEIIHELKLI